MPRLVGRAVRACPGCGALTRSTRCADCREASSRPSAARRGYGRRHRLKRKALLERSPRCVDCGGPATVRDHVTPKAWGGADDESNEAPRCASCHSRKTARQSSGWGR